MHNEAVQRTVAKFKGLGFDYYDATRLAESIHSVAKLMHLVNEIQCSVNTRAEKELEAVDQAITTLAHAIINQIGVKGQLQGDPRGWPIDLHDSRLATADRGYSIKPIMPWEVES
jgi:hypothetical protein